MKKIITNFILACATLPAFCQITLTQSNYPPATTTIPLQDVSSQITTPPAISNNQTWDYSTLTQGSSGSNPYQVLTNDPNFPAAQFMLNQYFKNLTPNLGYYYDQYYEITAAGAYVVGIHVPAQRYGLGAMTGNNNDTLYILDNVIYYPASPRPLVVFPATAGSGWKNVKRHLVNMELTVTAASLNKTPMQQAFYLNRMDSIVGWGTLKLPAQPGFNSNVPVLQDMVFQNFTDSFYLGGSPAPPSITNAFGITQGQTTGQVNRLIFYRAGSFNYQMFIGFTDNTFTTPNAAYMSTELPVASGINDIAADISSSVYPNPVNGNQFAIYVGPDVNAATVSLRDISGRLIETMTPIANGSALNVHLSHPLTDGLYIYTVIDASGKTIANGKLTAAK